MHSHLNIYLHRSKFHAPRKVVQINDNNNDDVNGANHQIVFVLYVVLNGLAHTEKTEV